MAKALFTNNATATLASPVATAIATTAVLTASQGALFPAPSGGNYFYATLVDASNNKEIVKVTANAADTFTMVRGQEGTTALTFAAGSRVELRPTAAGLTEKVATGDINATILTALASAPTGTGAVVLDTAPNFTGPVGIGGSAGSNELYLNGFAVTAKFPGTTKNGVDLLDLNDANSAWFVICRNSSNTVIGGIQRNLTTNAVLFQTSSDYRMKENIVPMTGCTARLKALKPSVFSWKGVGSADEGFIAHELQTVVPHAVTGDKDAIDGEGNPKYQCVDYSKVIPVLVGALQEAITAIEGLKARIEILEGGA